MNSELRASLHDALNKGSSKSFLEAAGLLLKRLGFQSERTLPDQTGRVADLPEAFQVRTRQTKSAKAFRSDALSVYVLFQLGDEEIRRSAQADLLKDADMFEAGATKSFLFVAVELRGQGRSHSYSRTRYSEFAREVNQGLGMPAFVLFREAASGRLALALVDRRPHKQMKDREVLSRVSLIRDIDPRCPHRAHLDILAELSLNARLRWMESTSKSRDFDGLRAAVLDALDTQALNRRFYKELFKWFERALDEATFPVDASQPRLDAEHHVIRLITRLMFIWFIKEKGLVAHELFVEEKVSRLLNDSARGDTWYRAVLQNLFFATLNSELHRRSLNGTPEQTHLAEEDLEAVRGGFQHRDLGALESSPYRYRKLMAAPEQLVKLFEKTPFINGGLFECLDGGGKDDADHDKSDGACWIDCFTDNEEHWDKLHVPDRLFFGDKGLIPLFERYRFTIEENTPIEKEVALDPELLGSVFENLLAAVNPETRETARKESGSFYTPRPIVDYMVRETLLLALASKTEPKDGDDTWWRDRLQYLLDTADAFNDAEELFEFEERRRLVKTVADLTVLDPAVGSGAFLISMLHSLTLVLRRLDPGNELWKAEQRSRAARQAGNSFLDPRADSSRKEELDRIEGTFKAYRDSDFGRKLYLIQNCLHGVDIQPVACLIAKLRFFISLTIEQETSRDEADNNYGIRPLPNLETRILAADSLIPIGARRQRELTTREQEHVTGALRANRERHFHATTPAEKAACRRQDGLLRASLKKTLQTTSLNDTDAARTAEWNPYDQNATANWFDPDYMFGEKGFDIVLGNPPYRQLQKDGGDLNKKYKGVGFRSFAGQGDIYQLFIEKGLGLLLSKQSVLAYVTSNSWQKARYGMKTRELLDGHSPLQFINLGPGVFQNAVVDTCVLIVRRGYQNGETCRTLELREGDELPPSGADWACLRQIKGGPWCVLSRPEWRLMEKIEAAGTPLGEWPGISINYGIKTGLNDAFIVDNDTKEALVREDPRSAELLKPSCAAGTFMRTESAGPGLWLIATFPAAGIDINDYPAIRKYLLQFGKRLHQTGEQLPGGLRSRKKTQHAWWELQDSCSYHETFLRPKIFWRDMSERPRFAYCESQIFCNNKAFFLSMKEGSKTGTVSARLLFQYLVDILNSRVVAWFGKRVATTTGAGLQQWIKFTVETIPVPEAGRNSTLAAEADVVDLYGLTAAEVRLLAP